MQIGNQRRNRLGLSKARTILLLADFSSKKQAARPENF
jgi:hypothetical protein